jgi:hypothetical protein
MSVDDGMVTLNGVRYRLDDAIAWGLYDPEPQGRHVAPEEGAAEGEEGPVTAAAPAPENKETQPKARPTAKE